MKLLASNNVIGYRWLTIQYYKFFFDIWMALNWSFVVMLLLGWLLLPLLFQSLVSCISSSLCNQLRPWYSFCSSCLYLFNAGFRHMPPLCLCSVWTIWDSRVRKESTLPNWSKSPTPHNWRTKIGNKKVTVLNQTKQISKRFPIPYSLNSHILALSVFIPG